MKISLFLIISFTSLFFIPANAEEPSSQPDEYRKWTRTSDKVVIEAMITDKKWDYSEVHFLMKDGRTPWVKTNILIPTDQELIKGWLSPEERLAVELGQAYTDGKALTAEQVQEMEGQLTDTKDNCNLRAKLIGYYSSLKPRAPEIALERAKHIYWMIETVPERTSNPTFIFLDRADKPHYEKAKQLWMKQVETHPQDTAVLKNAAQWFSFRDFTLAEDCLIKASNLKPLESEWWDRLGDLYTRGGLDNRFCSPSKALAAYEKAETLDTGSFWQKSRPLRMAKSAYLAGFYDKSTSRAEEALRYVGIQPNDDYLGEAIHTGNTILGLIAMKTGDTASAKGHLLKSGGTHGSYSLNNYGPSMMLANELLGKGEKDVVVEYFTLCGKFWKSEGWLEKASQEIKQGKNPEFGHLLKKLP